MIYYCDGKIINISDTKKPLGKGSEGFVYKIGDMTYKIYHQGALQDNFGLKEKHHEYLSTIPTKQIILPKHAILNEDGEYVGYSAPFIKGSQKEKTGISQLDKKIFLDNIRQLLVDFKLLSDCLVLCADVQPINYIFDSEDEKMYIIDPGRYKHHVFVDLKKYERQNIEQYSALLDLLIMNEIYKYKPINTKRKQILLKDYIIKDRKTSGLDPVSFYEDRLADFSNIHEYAKSLTKYIR